jgi:hypothetical protein
MTSHTSIPAIDSTINSDTNISIPSEITFNRENIEKYLSNKVRLVNSQDGLDQFCYTSCNKDEPEIVQQCRGVIFNKNQLVSKCFPYTVEYTEDNHDEIVSLNLDLNNCKFYTSHEGCTIKLFYLNDKWYVSTNRKLDCFLSKWASKVSFGDFFSEALTYQFEINERLRENVPFEKGVNDPIEVFTRSVLDKSKQYVFLLLNNSENRIVCDSPDNPTIFHVGTFTNNNEEFTLSMDDDVYIPYPQSHSFTDIKDIYEYVYNINYTKTQGIVIFAPNNKQYKILNIDYKDLYNIRGNEPSINYRYLQVRMDSRKNEMIRFLYPSHIPVFEEYENYLYDTAKFIYKSYVDRFINKQTVTIPKEEYRIMSAAHTWYQTDRENNRISINKVIEIMNDQQPTHLNSIIRRLKLEKKKKTQEKKEDKQHKRLLV